MLSARSRILLAAVITLGATSAACAPGGAAPARSPAPANAEREAEVIRATERRRVRALVEADMETARALHADDFQLINPVGVTYSRDQYLGEVASGVTDYVRWEPDSMQVRLHGEVAVIRYRSLLEVAIGGRNLGLRPHWHTDLYEKRNGRWQVVWSHATIIQP